MNVEIILEIIIIIMVLYLALFKSYFQEKGKNIATSEDIEKLTLKVETVKQQFLEKNANLKAKLDLLTNLQINRKNDERLALINFHKKIKKWIRLLTQFPPPLINEDDTDEIKSKYRFYDSTYQEVLSAQALIEIYVEDKKLLELIDNLIIETLENLAKHPVKCLTDLKNNNFEFDNLNLEQITEKRTVKHSELLEKREKIFETYRDNMIVGLKTNIPFERKYTNYVREYIKNISTE